MLISKFKGLGLAVTVGIVATAAMVSDSKAQVFTQALMDGYSCSDAVYGTNGTYFDNNNQYTARSVYSAGCVANNTANTAGSVVTAATTLRAAVSQTVGIVSSRIASVKNGNASLRQNRMTVTSFNATEAGGELGLAGGDTMNGMGVWAQGQYVKFDDSNTSTNSDGSIGSLMVGADTNFQGDAGIVGVSFGYQTGDITTTFNGGNVDMKALIVAPYVSYSIDDMFSIDATAGYATVDYKNARSDSASAERFTGKNTAKRMFGSAVLNASTRMDDVILTGKLGASYSREAQAAFTETGTTGTTVSVASQTAKLGQAIAGATVTFKGDQADPFINLLGEYDFTKTKVAVASTQTAPSSDKFGLRIGGGVNFDMGSNLTALIEANTVLLRKNYKEHTGTVRIRAEF